VAGVPTVFWFVVPLVAPLDGVVALPVATLPFPVVVPLAFAPALALVPLALVVAPPAVVWLLPLPGVAAAAAEPVDPPVVATLDGLATPDGLLLVPLPETAAPFAADPVVPAPVTGTHGVDVGTSVGDAVRGPPGAVGWVPVGAVCVPVGACVPAGDACVRVTVPELPAPAVPALPALPVLCAAAAPIESAAAMAALLVIIANRFFTQPFLSLLEKGTAGPVPFRT
jgi:hypothetical protein